MLVDLNRIVEEILRLSIVDCAKLCKILEERLGVSNVSQVNLDSNVNVSTDSDSSLKDEFDVRIVEIGSDKIGVIKEVRKITGLGLVESKNFVESLPKVIKSRISKVEAEEVKLLFEKVGAKIIVG